jgi:hypothetical protein
MTVSEQGQPCPVASIPPMTALMTLHGQGRASRRRNHQSQGMYYLVLMYFLTRPPRPSALLASWALWQRSTCLPWYRRADRTVSDLQNMYFVFTLSEHSIVCGHEFIGEVVALGANFHPGATGRPLLYSILKVGDKVVSPFTVSCGECQYVVFPFGFGSDDGNIADDPASAVLASPPDVSRVDYSDHHKPQGDKPNMSAFHTQAGRSTTSKASQPQPSIQTNRSNKSSEALRIRHCSCSAISSRRACLQPFKL